MPGTEALLALLESLLRWSKVVGKDVVFLDNGEILPRAMAAALQETMSGDSSVEGKKGGGGSPGRSREESEDEGGSAEALVIKQKEHKTLLQQAYPTP
ncbi:hypothetical protein T484DRAFT_1783517 [Baffinella frigidus]|nr:hypothetical protein T484DRAFT_1783517 [Cryptophyta sp. CCMP2293]